MPIRNAIWKVDTSPQLLTEAQLPSEKALEDMIVAAPSMLSDEWMLIGQQEYTTYGGRIDLLAMAPDGSLVLIELKRDKTPREIVAQALDYASWVQDLTADRIVQIYERFSKGGSLQEAFQQRFVQLGHGQRGGVQRKAELVVQTQGGVVGGKGGSAGHGLNCRHQLNCEQFN